MARYISPEEWRGCKEKTAFETPELAEARAHVLGNLKHPRKKIRHLSVYKCTFCPKYHLTTKQGILPAGKKDEQ